ncbi:serine/threonine-protein kinase NIM1-like isoform X2 [Zootermopsis nevadensis]|uniref:serine/threonine-protein kinase NIM1-like isoform X2 n=1 Tax=Zootermopsis nevadensis TaxID=136037 RepID=UPI000B8E3CF0|nr:serine/threonine-protein kinase NIM1-like isoform X2 [Zootermopsis nevadensis]
MNRQVPQNQKVSEDNSSSGVETPYQRLLHSLHHDQRWLTEVSLGKRVGFYRFQGELGSGNFSQVKMAIHQLTKERVAVKILDKAKLDQKTRRMLAKEIGTMEYMHHPNIIRLYEVVETYSKIHLVMEYASGGELFNKITTTGRIAENDAKKLFAQVVSAVQFMHDHNFVHRDIKAENVFYAAPGLVKLGDFGFSTQLTDGSGQKLNTFCGSPPYAAPELFRDEMYLGAPVDIWALGVLLYFMVTAQMPFKAPTVAVLKKHVLEGTFSVPGHVSFQCRKMIEGILKKEPRERLTLQEICNSVWLKGITFPLTPGASDSYSLSPNFDTPVHKTPENSSGNALGNKDNPEIVVVSEGNKESLQSGSEGNSVDNQSSVEGLLTVGRDSVSRQQSYSGSEKKENNIVGIEMLARKELLNFGITNAMLEKHSSQGARSAIIGTYRILVHRMQRQGHLDSDTAFVDDGDASSSAVPSRSVSTNHFLFSSFGRRSKSAAVKSKGHKPHRTNRSRTCILL